MAILTPQERVGSTLDGKYRLERILGEGGFGVVFAASHIGLDRPVAIKMLHRHLSDQADVVGRFLREARATSTLHHPNVIDVRDVVLSPENGVYMVLELLEGETLSKLLERKGRLDLTETMQCVGPILDAMRAAHDVGIVHRDLKPDNIFLSRTPEGLMVPKLLDFGIAKLAEAGRAMATATGMVLGTPIYMAPEQAMGRTKEIGPPTDVWSMAVVLYECLAGSFPFDLPPDPTPTAVVIEVVTGRIVPLEDRCSDVPPSVCRTLGRALERDVGARLSSMRELSEALNTAVHEQTPRPVARAPDHQRLPPTLVATGPLAAQAASPAAPSAFEPREIAPRGPKLPEASQRTGPMPGSVALLDAPSSQTLSSTTARMFAQLRQPSGVPTWIWAAAAAAALVGTIVMWALTLQVGTPETAETTEPPATPVRTEPALVVPAPTLAVRDGEPAAPPSPALTEAPVAPRPETASAFGDAERPRPPRTTAPRLAPGAHGAAEVHPHITPPAVATAPHHPPPAASPPEPPPPTIVHRASDVTLDDF